MMHDPEVCICAAVMFDGEVVFGHRHCHAMQTAIERRWAQGKRGAAPVVQGFVTSRGRFVEREEAYRLQVAAGIASKAPGGYRGERLFSEDLY